jgi:hypothetical protein
LKFRRSNSSRRICQTRPMTKPSASAAKISKAITIASHWTFPLWAKATTLAAYAQPCRRCGHGPRSHQRNEEAEHRRDVETTLAARQLGTEASMGLGERRIYGCFPTIAGIWYLTILGEAGKPSCLMRGACARRWRASRRRVRVIVPDSGISDMNDVLLQGGGWHVHSDWRSWPGLPEERTPELQRSGIEPCNVQDLDRVGGGPCG